MNSKILLLCILNALSSMGYSLVAPLFPDKAQELNISKLMTGIIMASFAFSISVTVPFAPNILHKFGRKNLFYFSIFSEVSHFQ